MTLLSAAMRLPQASLPRKSIQHREVSITFLKKGVRPKTHILYILTLHSPLHTYTLVTRAGLRWPATIG